MEPQLCPGLRAQCPRSGCQDPTRSRPVWSLNGMSCGSPVVSSQPSPAMHPATPTSILHIKAPSASPPGAAPSQLPWDNSGMFCRISHRAPEGLRPRRHHQAPFVGLLPLCLAPTYLSAIRGCAPHSPRAPSLRCASGVANLTPGDWIQGLQSFHR